MALELGAALGAAIAIAFTAIATAYAQAKVGAAAVGALAEDDSIFGKALLFVALPETIVIFGLVVALVIAGFI